MIIIFVLSVLVSLVSGAVLIKGPCPDVTPVKNFNVTALAGTWYEVARYPNTIEEQGDCELVEYTPNNGTMKIKGQGIFNGNLKYIDGYMYSPPTEDNLGYLNFYSNLLEVKEGLNEEPSVILDIDYSKYFIIYECKYDESKDLRHDFTWIVSKSKTLQADDKQTIEKFIIKTKYLDYSLLMWLHFDEKTCRGTIS